MAFRLHGKSRNISLSACLARPATRGSSAPPRAWSEAFHADFTALFVQNSSPRPADAKSTTLRDNLKLAEDLGAVIVTLQGDGIPVQIAEYARMSGVSKIVVGRSPARAGCSARARPLWSGWPSLRQKWRHTLFPMPPPAGRPTAGPRPMLGMLRALLGTATALVAAVGGLHYNHGSLQRCRSVHVFAGYAQRRHCGPVHAGGAGNFHHSPQGRGTA